MSWIDHWLNRVTMYRLAMYVLLTWLAITIVLGSLGIIHLSGAAIAISAGVAVVTCWLANHLFARVFGAPAHSESALITALILALIVPPTLTVHGTIIMFWTGLLAIAGKYIITWQRQHLFNPAALAVAITAATLNSSTTWWISNIVLLPAVIIGGWLILRKLQKEVMVMVFILVAVAAGVAAGLIRHVSVMTALRETVVLSPLIFFASVMLTEPLTMPGTKGWRYVYASLVGLLFTPSIHLGRIYSTPELALLVGNFFGFLIQSRQRYRLILVKIEDAASGVRDFIFRSDHPITFRPGQYLELMAKHRKSDGRGQRRYFTIASAPSEQQIRFGVKFYDQASSFKLALWHMQPGQTITAAQLGGDFTLPKNPQQPLVFIAGGIGVTPFRSMIAELLRRDEPRLITLFYSVNGPTELAYGDVFNRASQKIGLRVVPTVTDPAQVPAGWTGRQGPINPTMITEEIPDFLQRMFYLSGPQSMVNHFKTVLKQMGLPARQIKTDFFPGFA